MASDMRASNVELGASNEMEDSEVHELCGFKASGDFGSSGSMSEDRLRSAAMELALSDVASITNSAASQRPKLTRDTIKHSLKRFWAEGSKAAAVCNGLGPLFFAVIHAKDADQVTQNVQLALEEGVAGVFIINHDFDYPQLLPILRQVRGRFPDAFVGVNFHTINGGEAFPILGRLAREGVKMDAYWADNACIQDASIDQASAEMIASLRQRSGWDGLYFGGTAFKNPRQHAKLCTPVPAENLTQVAEAASRYMDIVTTSGPDTAVAPDAQKIALMRAGCLDTPLCVASGVTSENVQTLFEDVDCVFAASSIQKTGDKTMLDRSKLQALLSAVRGS